MTQQVCLPKYALNASVNFCSIPTMPRQERKCCCKHEIHVTFLNSLVGRIHPFTYLKIEAHRD